jgi:GR25 family glycosyltransferase involved in LPS biosynthesis
MTLQYYLIHNLDEKRKEIMNREFSNWNYNGTIKWVLYPNKDDITEELINKLVIQEMSYSCGFLVYPSRLILRKGTIACTFKHYTALKDIVENNYDYGVIMEDNIYFLNKKIPELVTTYIKQLDSYGEWDILFDGPYDIYDETQMKPGLLVYPKSNEFTPKLHGSTRSATFYLLTNSCAKKLYENYIPFNNAPDWWMNDLFRKLDIKSFWVEPSNVRVQDNHVSTANP